MKRFKRNYLDFDRNWNDSILKLNLSNKNDFELFKELNKAKYPCLRFISISFIENLRISEVKAFLSKSFPSKLSNFEFNYSKRPTETWDLLDLSDFIDNLK